MKRIVSSVFALAFLIGLGQTTYAAVISTAEGHVQNLYADGPDDIGPNDFVIRADVTGSCGSNFFHIQRNNINFTEMTAIALMAFSKGKTMFFFVASCKGSRNILDHAAIFN